MNPRLSIAIVGCGLIGRKRAAALAPGSLAYACDLNHCLAENLANIHQGCFAITDYQVALRDPAVDAVIVATFNAALAPIALDAVRAKKHVLVEKPGGLSSSELIVLREAALNNGVIVHVGYNLRSHPALRKAREMVDIGKIGSPIMARGRYGHGGRIGYDREWRADVKLSGGGELIDQGVHLIDLASWFLGEFTRIDGHCTTHFWDMKVDDNAFLSLRTEAGETAWLQVSCTEWKNLFCFELYGLNGKLVIEGLGGSYGTERLIYQSQLGTDSVTEQTWEYAGPDDSWAHDTNAFLQNINVGILSSSTLDESIRILHIVENIYRTSGYDLA
jgi:predicted dehydrogenase